MGGVCFFQQKLVSDTNASLNLAGLFLSWYDQMTTVRILCASYDIIGHPFLQRWMDNSDDKDIHMTGHSDCDVADKPSHNSWYVTISQTA